MRQARRLGFWSCGPAMGFASPGLPPLAIAGPPSEGLAEA